jgi:hypothetical protein
MANLIGRFLSLSSVLYMLIPSILFVVGWLRFPFNLISELILAWITLTLLREIRMAVMSFSSARRESSPERSGWRSLRWLAPVLVLITIWVLASGVGGFGLQNTDYRASNALLKDLIYSDWPLTGLIDGAPVPVVYYIGYYLPAAGIGKLLGWNAANLFMFLWTLLGLLLAFGWFWRISRVHMHKNVLRLLVLGIIFCLAGGLDYFGSYILKADIFKLSRHIENWAVYFQYSSNTTLLYWVPQHAIAAWLSTGLVLNTFAGSQTLKLAVMGIASAILWSPFGVIGLLPFLIAILFMNRGSRARGRLLRRHELPFVAGAIWIGGIHLLYLGSSQFQFPIGFIFAQVQDKLRYIQFTLAFWILEFGALALMVAVLVARAIRQATVPTGTPQSSTRMTFATQIEKRFDLQNHQVVAFFTAVLILVTLPLFQLGVNNDLVMRVSIPATFTFWTVIAKIVMDMSPEIRLQHYFLSVVVVGMVLASFFPAIAEISRSVTRYQLGAPAVAEVGTTFEISPRDTNQRMGSEGAFFQKYLSK